MNVMSPPHLKTHYLSRIYQTTGSGSRLVQTQRVVDNSEASQGEGARAGGAIARDAGSPPTDDWRARAPPNSIRFTPCLSIPYHHMTFPNDLHTWLHPYLPLNSLSSLLSDSDTPLTHAQTSVITSVTLPSVTYLPQNSLLSPSSHADTPRKARTMPNIPHNISHITNQHNIIPYHISKLWQNIPFQQVYSVTAYDLVDGRTTLSLGLLQIQLQTCRQVAMIYIN